MALLDEEIKTYINSKSELIKYKGMYVLIKEDDIIGIFKNRNDAMKYGFKMFGYVPFLVKKITKEDEPIFVRYRLVSE